MSNCIFSLLFLLSRSTDPVSFRSHSTSEATGSGAVAQISPGNANAPDSKSMSSVWSANSTFHFAELNNELLLPSGGSNTRSRRALQWVSSPGWQGQGTWEGEQDKDGKYVIDALVAYSDEAERFLMATLNLTLEDHYTIQETMQNYAFKMSGLHDIRLRVVGVLPKQMDNCLTADTLRYAEAVADNARKAVGADVVAYFVYGDYNICPQSPTGHVMGLTYTNGFTSIISLYSAFFWVWPHELGHSAGLGHCDIVHPSMTIMCHDGNHLHLPVYSNPAMSFKGRPLGDYQKADAVRIWNTNKGRLSGREKRVFPFENEDGRVLVIKHNSMVNQGQMMKFVVPQNTIKLVIRAHPTSLEQYNYLFKLIARHESSELWNHQRAPFNVNSLVVRSPSPGVWLAACPGISGLIEVECSVPRSTF